ncbi:MAG: TetR/AcrR family transcriptional regulator [Desulfitobacteriaceae bacterium]
MPDLSRRERKKLETRDRIYYSALQLFQLQGFEETSIEQITQQADVGKGTFYNYFTSKEAVVTEFSTNGFKKLLNSERERPYSGIRERLNILLQDWAAFMVKNHEMTWVTVRNRDCADFDLGLHYGIQAILNLGQKNGEISRSFDSSFLAESLEGMMLQHFISWYVSREGDLLEEMEKVLSVFLDGLMEIKLQA